MPEAPNAKLYKGALIEPPLETAPCRYAYAELDVTTNYSFLRGASHPDELIYTAALLGYRAIAITDVNSVAGVVRAFEAARKVEKFQLIVGSRLVFNDGSPDMLVWPTDYAAYGQLCRLLTLGRRRAPKGECHLTIHDFLDHQDGMLAAVDLASLEPASKFPDLARLRLLHDVMNDRLSLAVSLSYDAGDLTKLHTMALLARQSGIALLATNHVHYHDPGRRPIQDVLTCIRHGCTIQQAGYHLFPNAERYLKSPEQMHALFAAHPEAIERGLKIASRCRFRLDDLKYEYPIESVPPQCSSSQYLRELTYSCAAKRYPDGVSVKVSALLEKELAFICGSKYESYFLTVYDLVREARSRGILCQGRGSAANSAVCYCLGVTSVDPEQFQLVFERFASGARAEPPDIDIDFEHERREEVIQYVYEKYGRERAAMTASLTTYRGRSAVRDVGKALGFGEDMLDQLAGKLDWWHDGSLSRSHLQEAGVNPDDPGIRRLIGLTTELLGFPRHLSQHVGGMVISRRPLHEIVPIANAAMEDRTVIEWDKDDLDVIGIFKVDILALGMLTCLSKAMAFINAGASGEPIELHTIPNEEPATYDMICDADTIGVFQIESRAQMSMLPRLRPREFYDLVIEVAIVRPGPIVGQMVHPYLRQRELRRGNPEYQVKFPKPELAGVLEKTLGVPLFQEQVMRLAIVAAGFSGEEADQLRRAMAAWKRSGGVIQFHDKFVNGMTHRGYEQDFAERCFKQICGFGEYGFPESHAASFAKLVYASAWLKRHHPAAFCAGLLNSQPMGFYAPAQLVRDAREHGVTVRPVDINYSEWDSTLEYDVDDACSQSSSGKETWGVGGPAVRLGMRQVKGMRQTDADRIVTARSAGGFFRSVDAVQRRAGISVAAIQRLSEADAMASLRLTRRRAAWQTMELSDSPVPLIEAAADESRPAEQLIDLPSIPLSEEVRSDYQTVGLSLKCHPVFFARPQLNRWGVTPAAMLANEKNYPRDRWVKVAGLVLVRQRPGTASGIVFITLEDETGVVNLIVWSDVYERYRKDVRHATLLQADGTVQREGQVIHILAHRFYDRTALLEGVSQPSRDFH